MENTISNYLDDIEIKFENCFLSKGYIRENTVDITSQIDPTVDFIGSKISPLKKHVLTDDIRNPGYFLVQNCIKLKSLKTLKTNAPQIFGGYYKCMGTLASPDLERSTFDLFDYLTNPNYLGISAEDICIRISSTDKDLVEAISGVDKRIHRKFDTVEMCHYRHTYGLDDLNITGRDYNIGIRKSGTDTFINCGTFVVMETPSRKLAVDMGLGNLSFSMCHFGCNSTIESSRMADLLKIDSVEMNKFANALIVAATLLKENITNHSSSHFRKNLDNTSMPLS